MDLREYYSRIRDVQNSIKEPYCVLISMATPDGGKAGVLTETARCVAATQVAEGRARLATEEEAAAFHAENARKKLTHEEEAALGRVQFVMMPQKPTKPAKD